MPAAADPTPAQPDSTRERILTASLRLFAERGYRGTTIADIEEAAGLSPGSGGLYAHFHSKHELLAAAIGRSIALTEAGTTILEVLPLDDLRSELTLLGRAFLINMNRWRDVNRFMLRDGDQFPELLAEARAVRDQGYAWFAEWLRSKVKSGDAAEHDADAVATLFLGALSNYWQTSALGVPAPIEVDDQRFIETWVDTLLAYLRAGAETRTRGEP